MSNIIKFIRGAEADIPVLNQGEPAFTTDTHKVFIGDGAANHELLKVNDSIKCKNNASVAPAVTNDTTEGYVVNSIWADTTHDKSYICLDNTEDNAVWVEITASGEVNTASNIGNEVEIFKQKSTYDLEFRTLKAGSDKLDILTLQDIPIDIGNEATDRAYGYPTGFTIIEKMNSANTSGKIASVEFYVESGDMTNVKIAIFQEVSASHFTTRDYQEVEVSAGAGKKTVSVDLDVETGDFIGMYYEGGTLSNDYDAGQSYGSCNGGSGVDYIPCENQEFQVDNTRCMSIYGESSSETLDYITFDVDAEAVLADLTLTEADISDLGSYAASGANSDITSWNIGATLPSDHTYLGIVDSKAVGESVVFGDLLYFDWTATEWKKAKADAAATTPAMRIALESKGDGEACLMLVQGYIRDDSAFQFTSAIGYLSITTAGAIQYAVPSVSGNQVQRVGIGISADIMYFNPSIDVGEI